MSISLINRDYRQKVDSSIQKLLDDISDFEFITPNGLLFKMSDINKTIPIYLDCEKSRIEESEMDWEELISTIGRLEHEKEFLKNKEKRTYEELQRHEYLFSPIRQLKDAQENHLKNSPNPSPSDKVTIKKEIILKGYYTHNGKSPFSEIVLLMETLGNKRYDAESVAITLIHEMFHAFYDCDRRKNALNIPFVEEPLTEYATLIFLEELAKKDNQYDGLFDIAKSDVLRKKYSIGIAHYGFGYYLWENEDKSGKTLKDIHWIEVFRDAKYKISDSSIEYNEYARTFRQGIYPFGNEQYQMELLRVVMLNALLYANGVQLSLSSNCTSLPNKGKSIAWKKCGPNSYWAMEGNTLYLDGAFAGLMNADSMLWENLSSVNNIDQLVLWDNFCCIHFFHFQDILQDTLSRSRFWNGAISISVSHRNIYYVEEEGSIYDASRTTLYHCSRSATRFIIPSSVNKFKSPVFRNCTLLRHLTIPNSIDYIPDRTFCGCGNLETLTFKGITPPEVDEPEYLQHECIIRVPVGSKYKYEKVFPNHTIVESQSNEKGFVTSIEKIINKLL